MLDADQKKACETDKNSVVSAGAGAGKTGVLASRYVRLITEGKAGVENILTLTFTNKAASEMWARIYSMLLTEKENPQAEAAIRQFDRARISTIDSFCASVARNWAERFGIPRDFVQDNAASGERLKSLSLSFMLEHGENPALKEFIRINKFENVLENFFVSLGNEYIHIAKETDFDAVIDLQLKKLQEIGTARASELDERTARILALDGGFKALEEAKASLKPLPGALELFRAGRYEELTSRYEKVQPGKRTGAGNSEEIQLYKEYADEWINLKDDLLNCSATILAGPTLRELGRLTREFEEAVLKEKRSSGVLSFTDVAQMAVSTLTENLGLRAYYKRLFRYIMIDEFQDNNALQKNLLFLIAERMDRERPFVPGPEDIENDKLFFVGDEKQSIYRFRGADVSVFNKLKTDIGVTSGESITLHTNYRSEPTLIEFFNTVFLRVMEGAEKSFEAGFSPLGSRAANPAIKPLIKILYHPYKEEREAGYLSGDEAEAERIASFIQEAVEEKKLLVSDGKEARPVRYEDIAILLRSTGNQIIYERSFRQSGIPYNAVDVRTLFLEAPVADIYNILQIAVHPEDRLAYAGYLRSPFVNLDDQAFVDILKLNTEAFAEPPSAIESLASEQLLRYQRGRELFLEVKENARGSSIRELVTHLWYRAGYRYTILKEKRYAGYIDYFSYLIEIASTYDSTGKPLPVFLEFLRENLGKYERLPEISILKEEERGVKIMTIHKAKGLEFPVVICANAGNAGRKGEEISAPYYVSDEFGISFNLIRNPKTGKRSNYIYSLSKEEDDAKTLAEAKRLLYVTLTRAQNHLIISGCHTKMNRNNPGTFLNMVLRSLGWDGKSSPLESKELSSYIEEIPDIKREEIFARMRHENPADLRARARDYAGGRLISFSPMRTEYSVTELCTLATQSEVPSSGTVRELSLLPSDAVAGEDTEAAFGTLCHYVIEKMLLRTYRRDGIPDSLRRPFDEKDYPLFLSDAERLATGFLESDLGREAAADSSRRTELAFVSRYGTDEEPGYVSGKIDLLFRRGEEAVVVDFKSSRAIVPHEYDVQLTVYRKAARDLTGLPVRTIIFYLRSGESLEVDETIDIEALIRTNRESMIDT